MSGEKFRIIENRQSDNEDELEEMLNLECEGEEKRLRLLHSLLKYTWQSNFSAPVDELLKSEGEPLVLDVCCGTGVWIMEMARAYPNARFGGIWTNDRIRVLREEVQNVDIRRMDINSDVIPYKDETADYVFMRSMASGFGKANWLRMINEIFRVTKIGGYVEFAEFDIRLSSEGEHTKKILDKLRAHLTGLGGKPNIVMELPELLEKTGKFESINAEGLHIPVGDWAGSVGKLMGRNMKEFLRSNKNQLAEISDEDVEKAVAEFDASQATMFFGRIYGKKKASGAIDIDI